MAGRAARSRGIWVQQYYRVIDGNREKVIRREATQQGLPPGRLKLVSPSDLDARSSEKRGKGRTGYKTHFTQTCTTPADDDPDTGRPSAPNLITHVATTAATVTDVAMTEPIHDNLHSKNLLPGEHLVDAGYTSADLLLAARARGLTLLGPLLTDTSPPARSGSTTEAFTIDWQARHARCPHGATSTSCSPCTQRGTEAIIVRFDAATCQTCPAKSTCTSATRSGRQLSLRPRPVHEALQQARAEQTTDQWHNNYKIRAEVKGTMRQTTHVTGIRRARYLGLPKTTLEHNLAPTAINLTRYDT